MQKETFVWSPRVNPRGRTKLRTLTASFGDGYAQRAGDGINNKVQSWPLEFVGAASAVSPIIEFLDRHGGFRSFLWTPPLGVAGRYRAGEYETVALGAAMYSLSVTFEQTFSA